MKAKIHPQYNEKITVECSCGNSFETGSTASKLDIEVCSNCHPFYTGKQKLVDTAGRVDSFKKRLEKSSKLKPVHAKEEKKKDNRDMKVKKDDSIKISS